jgi:formylglycine-generating enzyme required for sulfatase activity
VLSLVSVLLAACGDEPAPAIDIPSWAKVAPEQIAEAEKHGVPVAFENDIGMRFVLIPAGTFMMGSPEDEEGRDDDETQHEVTISKPFYMMITEVTNGQYRRFEPDFHSYVDEDGSLDADPQPASDVSWNQVVVYGNWLTQRDGERQYGQPTEAQWEYACRAGSGTRFSFGDRETDLVRYANFSDLNDPLGPARQDLDDGFGVTAPVGHFLPNRWGLHDLHGNVWEWCATWYGDCPIGSVIEPRGPRAGSTGVLRGGSIWNGPRSLRCAARLPWGPTWKAGMTGFRLVSPLPEKDE